MANIQTILTQGGLNGQPQGGASAEEMGAGIGDAVAGLGQSVGQAGRVVGQIAEIKKTQQNTQWINDSMTQEQNYVNKWMADPVNNAKTTFADDLSGLLKERQSAYESKAPNDDAKRAFRSQFQEFGVSRLHSAYITSAQNQVTGLQQSVLTQIDDVTEGYRISRGVPNLDANGDLVKNINATNTAIDKMFGGIAPEMARSLKDKLIVDSTYTVMDYSPEFARKILDMGTIDGHQRHTIEDAIDTAERSRNSQDVATFEQLRQNHLAMVEAGKSRDKIDHSIYQSYYSREQANEHKFRDDNLIDIYNGVNDFKNKTKPWNASAQLDALQKLQDDIGKNPDTAFVDSKKFDLAAQEVAKNVEMIKKDPVAYMAENNPTIKKMRDQIAALPESDQTSRLGELAALTIRYQGPPQVSDLPNHDDSNMFFNTPRNQVSILTAHEAELAAGQINKGSPKDALNQIDAILNKYPEEYRGTVFNDLVKLPGTKGIKGEYWAAALNKNAPWIDDYIGILQNAESIKKATSDKLSDFEKAIDSNPTWLQFANPIASDNFQHQNVTEDFKNGIQLYAMGLAQRSSMSPDVAVKQAIKNILSEEMGMTSVNGKSVIVPRDPGKGLPYRTDAQVADIGRRLNLATKFIDPKDISLTDEYRRQLFPLLNMIGHEDKKMDALHDAILAHATFQTTPDGKAAVLYYNDGSTPFELRDKNKKALVIQFEDLPKFSRVPIARGLFGFNLGEATDGIPIGGDPLAPTINRTYIPVDTSKVKDYDKMNLAQKTIIGGSGNYIYTTNWPSTPEWIKRK